MNPLLDRLRRDERLLVANQWARRLWPFGLGLVLFFVGLYVGVRHRAPSQEDQEVVHRLDDLTDSLRLAHTQFDSLQHLDSLATAVVVKERPRVDEASRRIHVSADPKDSLVVVERPVLGDSGLVRVDSVFALPLPIATFIREAKVQLPDDTVLLHVKDMEIAELQHTDSLWQRKDSLHVEHEAHLQDEADSAYRRGFVKGAKVVVEVAAIVAGAIKLVRFIGR